MQRALHPNPPKLRQPTGKNQKAALAELCRQLSSTGESMDYRAAIQCSAAILNVASGKALDRAKDAIDALLRGGHLKLDEGGYRLLNHPEVHPNPNP